MSKIALEPNAAGTGTFSITAPNSNTNRSLTLPDETGTMLTGAGAISVNSAAPTSSLNVSANGSVSSTKSFTIGSSGDYSAGSLYSDTNWGMILRAKQSAPADAEFLFANADNAFRMRINTDGAVSLYNGTYSYGYNGQDGWSFLRNLAVRQIPTTAAANAVVFNNPNGQVGYINTQGSSVIYSTASDYRLKHDVMPMVDASARVMALKPVNFAWKADNTRVDGFLAHELQEVVPGAVAGVKDELHEDGSPKIQGIDQSKIVPLLTAALQEALNKIDALEAQNTAFETRLAALEAV